MADSTDLYELASDVRDAAVQILDSIPGDDPQLQGAPTEQRLVLGEPVWDCCDLLAVWVPRITEQATSPSSPSGVIGRRHVNGRVPLVSVQIGVTRCQPKGETRGKTYVPPTAAELELAGRQGYADAWALYNGLFNRQAQGLLTDVCDEMTWDGVEAYLPEGGCAGWRIDLRFQLDGYGYGMEIPS
jgi:hypothetical protein